MADNSENSGEYSQMVPLLMVGLATLVQVAIILLLWFLSGRGAAKPSIAMFFDSVTSSALNQFFLGAAAVVALAQQLLKAKYTSGNGPAIRDLFVLLAVGEVPGVIGLIAAILDSFNVSLALPFILLSLVLLMSVRSIALHLTTALGKGRLLK